MNKYIQVFLFISASFSLSVHAEQTHTSMDVRAEVVETCSITAETMNFGAGTVRDLVGILVRNKIIVNCPTALNWTVSLDGGMNTGATQNRGLRELHHSGGASATSGVFDYKIQYDDSSTGFPLWGDGSSAAQGDPVSGSGGAVLSAIGGIERGYVVTSSGSGNPAGIYSDSIIVTLDY